jgi:uncharacterized membrane protein
MCVGLIASVLGFVLVLPIPLSRRKVSLPADRLSTSVVSHDDRYWEKGIRYTNLDDPAMFVPKRFGLGWTLNFGHPQAKLVLIGTALLVLLPPLVVALLGVLFPGCHSSGCYPSFP